MVNDCYLAVEKHVCTNVASRVHLVEVLPRDMAGAQDRE